MARSPPGCRQDRRFHPYRHQERALGGPGWRGEDRWQVALEPRVPVPIGRITACRCMCSTRSPRQSRVSSRCSPGHLPGSCMARRGSGTAGDWSEYRRSTPRMDRGARRNHLNPKSCTARAWTRSNPHSSTGKLIRSARLGAVVVQLLVLRPRLGNPKGPASKSGQGSSGGLGGQWRDSWSRGHIGSPGR